MSETTTETYDVGIHMELDEELYHSLPGLASTGIKKMLDAPAIYEQYLKDGDKPREAFDVGSAAHAKILGVGAGVIAYPDEHLTPSGNVSTKAATVAWATEQRAAGLTPVSPDQIARVDAMAEAVLGHTDARVILTGGDPEVSLIWDDPDTGARCRGRIDYVRNEGLLVDLKTAESPRPATWGGVSARLRYPEQRIHYGEGWRVLTGSAPRFLQVVVDKVPPHLVFVAEFDEPTQDKAAENVRWAIDAYAKAQASGEWPRLADGIHRISAPRWYLNDENEEF
jgi:hypothetical protein